MTDDLKRQLQEMGPEYAALVRHLKTPPRRAVWQRPSTLGAVGALMAASLLVACVFAHLRPTVPLAQAVAFLPREYRLAALSDEASVREIISTQRADGGWRTDFLTRRNAAALKVSPLPEARLAYRKAARHLRLRGLL